MKKWNAWYTAVKLTVRAGFLSTSDGSDSESFLVVMPTQLRYVRHGNVSIPMKRSFVETSAFSFSLNAMKSHTSKLINENKFIYHISVLSRLANSAIQLGHDHEQKISSSA